MNKFISISTTTLVALLAVGAFVLSYEALRHVALDYGIPTNLAYIWPLLIDFALIVFSLAVLRANLRGERTVWPWSLVAIFTLATIGFNLIHAPGELVARLVAVVAPISLFLSFETLMSMVKSDVVRGETITTLDALKVELETRRAEFDAEVETHRTELDKLSNQLDAKRQELDQLKATIKATNAESATPSPGFVPGNLAMLDKANEVRQDKAEERRALVLSLLQEGLTTGDISERLNVSLRTIQRDLIALNGKVNEGR